MTVNEFMVTSTMYLRIEMFFRLKKSIIIIEIILLWISIFFCPKKIVKLSYLLMNNDFFKCSKAMVLKYNECLILVKNIKKTANMWGD